MKINELHIVSAFGNFLCRSLLFIIVFSLIPTINAQDSEEDHHISFVKNLNQWENPILYKVTLNGGAMFAEKNRFVYVFLDGKQQKKLYEAKLNPNISYNDAINAHAYSVNFVNSSSSVEIEAQNEKNFYHNYFLGNDPDKWAARVPVFESLLYHNLYDGVDLHYFEQGDRLKYEFIVSPSASPEVIEMDYIGVDKLTLKNDNLKIHLSVGDVFELKPYAYQEVNGNMVEVAVNYVLKRNRVSFSVGEYDHSLPLIIDPTLIFSTYTGSTADNWGFTATFDSQGAVFGGGISFTVGYPVSPGAYQMSFAGGSASLGCDITISKFSALGNTLIYSTYLGGSANELPHSLIANHNDELYLFGTTSSQNFPVTTNCYNPTFSGGTAVTLSNSIHFDYGSDIVVVKFNSSGTQLLGSTFVGGTSNDGLNTSASLRKNYADEVRGEIVLDGNSNVYVISSTSSTDFPVSTNAFQTQNAGTSQEAVIFKLNHNLTNMTWSSYFGGLGQDAGYSLVLNDDQSLFFCGGTTSLDLPNTTGAFQSSFGGGISDGFVAHLSNDGSSVSRTSYLGLYGYDQSYLVKNDKNNFPHVYGQSYDTSQSWVINASWYYGSGQFIMKLVPNLDSVVWSTEFGTLNPGPDISPTALLVDLCNKIYMSGWGTPLVNQFGGTDGLPITLDAYQATTDNNDYYFICISDDASSLEYATYFGSPNASAREHVDGGTSRFDTKGRIYQAVCAGCGGNSTFPTTAGAYSNINGSTNCNLAVLKMDFNLPVIVADFNIPTTACAPITIPMNNQSQTISNNTTYFWDFGDGTTSTEESPSHSYTQAGVYIVKLVIQDLGSCNFADTSSHTLLVMENTVTTLDSIFFCDGSSAQIGIIPSSDEQVTYRWEPSTGLSNPDISNPMASPTTGTLYTLYLSNGVCFDTLVQYVAPIALSVSLPSVIYFCASDTVTLIPNIVANTDYQCFWSTSSSFDVILNEDLSVSTFHFLPTQDTMILYFKIAHENCEFVTPVTIISSPVQVEVQDVQILCFQDTVQIELITQGDYVFEWQPQQYVISQASSSNPWINPPSSMTFYFTATNSFGCTLSDSVSVLKQEGTFPLDLTAWASENDIFLGDTITLFATHYFDHDYLYQWTPTNDLLTPNAASTVAAPQETTIYTVLVTDIFGCTMQDTVFVKVTEQFCGEPLIFIPNAFTPNGDGKNDVLYVRSEILASFIFRIYDRWGELIFETTQQDHGWNGKYKGKNCPPAVYDYYFEGVCVGGESKYKTKGNITLIR